MKKQLLKYLDILFRLPLDYWIFLGLVAFFIWTGLIGLFLAYNEIGPKESLDFIWQLILFSFALVAAALAIPQWLTEEQSKKLPLLILCFVLSGGCFLGGFGLITIGVTGKSIVFQKAGSIVFGVATFPLSFGIAVVVMESFRKAFKAVIKNQQ